METEKLYYADVFCREFTARVLSCTPEKKGFWVVLDRTAFYPEGGGQPADWGTLDESAVSDVQEKDGEIRHFCENPLEIGTIVTGKLDWARRFDHMQQHSGEHIVSGLICFAYGYDNVGFHMGDELVTIDFNGELTEAQVWEIERRANALLTLDLPTEISYPTPEALQAIPYRSKKELFGAVRIVRFPEGDVCACCGTHVARAGQVALIKILSFQKFRGGVRLEMVSGDRALRRLFTAWEQNRDVAQALSVKECESFAAVSRLKEELAAAKIRLAAQEEAAFTRIAERFSGAGNVLLFEAIERPDSLRRLADTVAAVCGGRCAAFSPAESGFSYAIVQKGGDLRDFVKALNAALHGRGGGRDGFAQGAAAATREEIEAFFAEN